MSKVIFFLPFLIFLSCSILEQKISSKLSRNIAFTSFEELKVVHKKDQVWINGVVNVYGARQGYNTFDFPLLKLTSPYYSDVPYNIVISGDDNITCSYSANISQIKNSNEFTVNKSSHGDFLKCKYLKNSAGTFGFTYILPKFQPFEVGEANWMKGFYPDVVSNTEMELARIYEKLVSMESGTTNNKGKNHRLYYRERELLLKYVPDKIKLIFDPSRHEVQFKTKLEKDDLFLIKNIKGSIIHPKYGISDFRGFSTDDYWKYGNSGRRYLAPEKVKAYGLFCRQNGSIYDFEYDNELRFDDAGELECSINTKRSNFMWFRKVKGQVEAEIHIMRIEKAKQLLPKLFLNDAKNNIKKKIDKMNLANIKHFKKWIQRAIVTHENSVMNMLEVDKEFSYNLKVNAKEVSVTLFNKPFILYGHENGKEYQRLSFHLYSRIAYEDEKGVLFSTSDKYLGDIFTSNIITDKKTIISFSSYYTFNADDFNENFKSLYLSAGKGDSKTINYKIYLNLLKRYSTKYRTKKKSADFQEIELSRFLINVCGQVMSYTTGTGELFEKVVLANFRARYDHSAGGSAGSYRAMYTDKFFFVEKPLEEKLEIFTPRKYTKDKDQCFFISPKDFSNSNIENAILLKDF